MDAFIPNRSICQNTLPVGSRNDKRTFLPFSSNTYDHTGRNVYIDAALLPKFLSLINIESHDGKMVLKHVVQLKAKAASMTSSSSVNDKFLHMDKVKHVQIVYQLRATEKDTKVSIYITDIRPAFEGDGVRFGLYRVDSGGRHQVEQSDVVYEDHATMSSGVDPDIYRAVEESRGIVGKNEWGGQREFSIMYTPSYLYNDLGAWITPEMKTYSPESAVEKLVGYLEKTQKYRLKMGKTEPVKWVVIGESAKLLALAINKVKGFLDLQGFKFVNPTTDISPLLSSLKRKEAKFAEKTVENTKTSRASLVAIGLVGGNIVNALREIGRPQAATDLASEVATSKPLLSSSLNAVQSQQAMTFMDAVNRVVKGKKW